MRWETKGPFLVSTEILEFQSIFKKSQASSAFQPFTPHASRGVKGCEAPVQMRRGPRVSSTISTHDSDIPSSCDMKHEHKLKPLQGNPAFFWVRPLAVHSTWDRKDRVPVSYLLLRENSTWGACGKLTHHFSQSQIISSHLETICGAWSVPRVAVLELIFI